MSLRKTEKYIPTYKIGLFSKQRCNNKKGKYNLRDTSNFLRNVLALTNSEFAINWEGNNKMRINNSHKSKRHTKNVVSQFKCALHIHKLCTQTKWPILLLYKWGYPDSLPGYLDGLPGYLSGLPGYLNGLLGYFDSLPGYLDRLPGYLNGLLGYFDSLPGYLDRLPGYLDSLPGYFDSLPGYLDSLPVTINTRG